VNFKNLGETLEGGTVIGSGGPGGDGYGEKPLQPENEIEPGRAKCGNIGEDPELEF
jgi:hypothetical protein